MRWGGTLLEHWVAQELIARAGYAGRPHRVSFWRTAYGVEVDFVWEAPPEDIPIVPGVALRLADFANAMTCPRCQAENREGRRFCSKCGATLVPTCASCGFSNDPGDEFCGGCGAPLRPTDTAQAKFSSPESYTPRHLAEKIRTSRTALEGERKHVTVLFADVKGSMELLAHDRGVHLHARTESSKRLLVASPASVGTGNLLAQLPDGAGGRVAQLDAGRDQSIADTVGELERLGGAQLATKRDETLDQRRQELPGIAKAPRGRLAQPLNQRV
jgi:hypothetical protein